MKTCKIIGATHEGLCMVKLDTMILGYTESETNMVQTMIMVTKALRKAGVEVEMKVEQI